MSAEDAHKRAIEDYSQYSQYARASAQFAFAANGGAAVAMLSFLTAIVTAKDLRGEAVSLPHVIHMFAFAALFYLLGVFLSVVAMYALSISKQYWGHFWEKAALSAEIDFGNSFALRADRFNRAGMGFLVASVLTFIPGSLCAVGSFIF